MASRKTDVQSKAKKEIRARRLDQLQESARAIQEQTKLFVEFATLLIEGATRNRAGVDLPPERIERLQTAQAKLAESHTVGEAIGGLLLFGEQAAAHSCTHYMETVSAFFERSKSVRTADEIRADSMIVASARSALFEELKKAVDRASS